MGPGTNEQPTPTRRVAPFPHHHHPPPAKRVCGWACACVSGLVVEWRKQLQPKKDKSKIRGITSQLKLHLTAHTNQQQPDQQLMMQNKQVRPTQTGMGVPVVVSRQQHNKHTPNPNDHDANRNTHAPKSVWVAVVDQQPQRAGATTMMCALWWQWWLVLSCGCNILPVSATKKNSGLKLWCCGVCAL
jgi:hypothetical protein